MNVGSLIWYSVAGPLLLYVLLCLHIAHRVFIAQPEPLPKLSWSGVWSTATRHDHIMARGPVVKALKEAMAGRGEESLNNHFTEDVEFEDMLMWTEGKEKVGRIFVDVCRNWIDDIEFEVHSEQHNEQKILYDWTLQIKPTFMSTTIPLRMRTHLYFDNSEKKFPKLYRILEEWNGNAQITERNTVSLVGRIQVGLRRFVGYFVSVAAQKGFI